MSISKLGSGDEFEGWAMVKPEDPGEDLTILISMIDKAVVVTKVDNKSHYFKKGAVLIQKDDWSFEYNSDALIQ